MSDKVRAVLVGCGGICGAWLGSLKQPDCAFEIVGLVDINEDAAKKRQAEYGLTHAITGTDLAAVIKQTKPDAVFDCTIPAAHVNVTTTALGLGCHVMGEKPLADSMEHARQSVAAAKAAGKTYAVIQNRRFDPRIRSLRKFLDQGSIGQVTTVNCDFYIGAHFGGFRDRMEHVLLLDMAIHSFDQARLISGADPVSVYCHEWNPAGSWYDHDAAAIAIFEMTNGLVLTYRGSWCAEGLNTSWECDWRIIGTQGSATWNGADNFAATRIVKPDGFIREHGPVPVPVLEFPGQVGGHHGQIANFCRCIKSGETPETVCSDNIKSLAMVFGAVESAESGKKVKIKI